MDRTTTDINVAVHEVAADSNHRVTSTVVAVQVPIQCDKVVAAAVVVVSDLEDHQEEVLALAVVSEADVEVLVHHVATAVVAAAAVSDQEDHPEEVHVTAADLIKPTRYIDMEWT